MFSITTHKETKDIKGETATRFFQPKSVMAGNSLHVNEPNDPDGYRDVKETGIVTDKIMPMPASRSDTFFKPQPFTDFALNLKSRGYGEEPKRGKSTPENSTESPSSISQASCSCSNLRLGEDRYEGAQKKVKILFDVEPGKDPHQCVLVQQVIGEKYLLLTGATAKKIYPTSIAILGEPKVFNFPNWEIDSNDKDPVLWSTPTVRWNYSSEGEHSFYATDSPSSIEPYPAAPAVSAAKFKTGLYCASQVPANLTDASQLGAPLQEIEWEDSTCWESGKEPTHPGFGKECVWSAAKIPE